jgi:outer membrane protein OmpA-like peptidoglycan-associated protein
MRYRSLLAAAVGLSFVTPAAAAPASERLLLAQLEPKQKEEESRGKSRREERQDRQGQDRQGQERQGQERQGQERQGQGQDRQNRQGQERQERQERQTQDRLERQERQTQDRQERQERQTQDRQDRRQEREDDRAKREAERDRERDARKAAEDKAKAERDAERAKRETEREARKAAEDKAKANREKAAAEERAKQRDQQQTKDRDDRRDRDQQQTRDRDGRDRDRDRLQTRDRDDRDRDDRDRQRAGDRDRDGRDRDGRDRDDRDRRFGDRRDDDDDDRRRYRERVREREERKTSIRELTNIQIRDGRVAIDGGRRTLYREGDRVYIRGNDFDRLRWGRGDERVERLPDGRRRIVVVRPDGSQIITIVGPRGEIIRRVRRDRGGREYVLIREIERAPLVRVDLGPLRLSIPREHYIVDARRASRRDFERALWAPPVEPVERVYSVEEVLTHERIRDIMPRIDLNTITFETDSAVIADDQLENLDVIADIILEMIEKNPAEQILVEGHTDGVGDETYNLALSDRRAESVAIALSEYYDIPPENLITQGYGETQLKIPTDGPERENRRVAFRRITPLVSEYGRR